MEAPINDFYGVIAWLASGAGAVIVTSWLASWLLEDWKAWAELPAKGKKILILVVALCIGIGGKALYLHPEVTAMVQPYLDTFVLIVIAWLTTQVAHKADK